MQYLVLVGVVILIYLIWRAYAVNAPRNFNQDGLPDIFNRVPPKYYGEDGQPTLSGFWNWLVDGAPGLHVSDMFGALPPWLWILLIILILYYGRSRSKL